MENSAARHAISTRFQPFGTSIFAEMTRLAIEHEAINLSQGFPDFDGADFVKQAAIDAIKAGHNQYARMAGVPPLNKAIAGRWNALTNEAVNPDTQVTITNGCTEGLAATCLGLLNRGDEVIIFEPYYDAYKPCLAMAGAIHRVTTLEAPDFALDRDQIVALINDRTRAIILNTPHNPTGKVFSRDELAFLAGLCVEHDLVAITDEVYENLVFTGEHIRIATLPGMCGRTITLASLGKSYSLTGWKVGWAIASEELSHAVRAGHQFLTFSVATPLQYAAIAAVEAPPAYFTEFVRAYRERRDFLLNALREIGFMAHEPAGTYFIYADHTPFGFADDIAFCMHLVKEVGVAAIPPTPFYDHPEFGRSLVRFAFCKELPTLEEAANRLNALKSRRS